MFDLSRVIVKFSAIF